MLRAAATVGFAAMGLDGVELVMEIEEEFNVKLDDEDTVQLRTVGQLIELLESKFTPESRRRLGPAFYRVRQVLADSLLVDKRSIRPATDLRPLIPASQLPGVWRDLEDAGYAVPPLVFSWRGAIGLIAIWLAMIVFGTKIVGHLTGSGAAGYTVGLTMFFFGWFLAMWLVEWLSRAPGFHGLKAIPASCATAGAIVRRWPRPAGVSSPHVSDASNDSSDGASQDHDDEAESESFEGGHDPVDRARKALCELLAGVAGISESQLIGTAELANLIPSRDRWRVWSGLKEAGLPMLPLRIKRIVRALIALPVVAVALIGALLTIVLMVQFANAGMIGVALLSTLLGFALVLLIAAASDEGLQAFGRGHQIWWLVSDIPREWRSLDDAARWLADHGWPYIPPPHRIRSRSIALRVRQIVAEQVGMPLEKVQPESRFVEDLAF